MRSRMRSPTLNTHLRIRRIAGIAEWAVYIRSFGRLFFFSFIRNKILLLAQFELRICRLWCSTSPTCFFHSRVFIAAIWASPFKFYVSEVFFAHEIFYDLFHCNFDCKCTKNMSVFYGCHRPYRSVAARLPWRVNIDDRGYLVTHFYIPGQERLFFGRQLGAIIIRKDDFVCFPGSSP